MALFQPPPTVVLPTIGEGPTEVYNPIWARWFVDLIDTLNTAVGGGGESTTLANAVFARREIPGTGIIQMDSQSILASQIFGG